MIRRVDEKTCGPLERGSALTVKGGGEPRGAPAGGKEPLWGGKRKGRGGGFFQIKGKNPLTPEQEEGGKVRAA